MADRDIRPASERALQIAQGQAKIFLALACEALRTNAWLQHYQIPLETDLSPAAQISREEILERWIALQRAERMGERWKELREQAAKRLESPAAAGPSALVEVHPSSTPPLVKATLAGLEMVREAMEPDEGGAAS